MASTGKRYRPDVLALAANLAAELFQLQAVRSGFIDTSGNDHQFTICEPKPRMASVAPCAVSLVACSTHAFRVTQVGCSSSCSSAAPVLSNRSVEAPLPATAPTGQGQHHRGFDPSFFSPQLRSATGPLEGIPAGDQEGSQTRGSRPAPEIVATGIRLRPLRQSAQSQPADPRPHDPGAGPLSRPRSFLCCGIRARAPRASRCRMHGGN
jgi:hypothetical protein